MSHPTTKIRTDIQALRGLAVLAVVLYHAKIGTLGGGYLGVDVFFVLSGFLITSLIKKAVENNSFSYRTFLVRRAKRLLPAAFVTFFFTALLAPFFLSSQELDEFWPQLLGALTFSANFVLANQSGYFSGAAELKPLLHVWSLAVEEQYYFILPAIFLFFPKRAWLSVLSTLAIISVGLCYVNQGEASTFFLLPTRAWELLIGSVGVFLIDVPWIRTLAGKLTLLSVLALVACLVLPHDAFHPGPQALLVCVSTLAVILAQHPVLQRGGMIDVLHKVGNISYSLYLVHWPIFSFYNNVVLANEHTLTQHLIRGALVALSLLLAWILHSYIEEPFRHGNPYRSYRPVIAGACAGILMVGMAQAFAPENSEKDYAFIRRANQGFGEVCASSKPFAPSEACRNSVTPTVLVWGDSFAMHLIPGLSEKPNYPDHIVQATMPRCGPLVGLAVFEFSSERWARECIDFNDTVLSYLKNTPEIQTVILSSVLTPYTKDTPMFERLMADGEPVRVQGTLNNGYAGLARTVASIRALGRDVIFVAPTPTGGFDVGRCLERQDRGLWIGGVDDECRIRLTNYKKYREKALALLDQAERELHLPIAQFDKVLCGDEFCSTRITGVGLYRDAGHLSHEGSVALFQLAETRQEIQRALRQSAQLAQQSATD